MQNNSKNTDHCYVSIQCVIICKLHIHKHIAWNQIYFALCMNMKTILFKSIFNNDVFSRITQSTWRFSANSITVRRGFLCGNKQNNTPQPASFLQDIDKEQTLSFPIYRRTWYTKLAVGLTFCLCRKILLHHLIYNINEHYLSLEWLISCLFYFLNYK